MRTARVVAQAKVNLFLRILAQEASGYHQLESLFCRLDLGDVVTLRTEVRGRSLDCAGEAMPADGLGPVEQNLAWRAAVAYAEAAGWPAHFSIEIEKRIPVGGGLGGGSADAGAVLRALNALNPAPLPSSHIERVGTALGADVPFLTQDVSPLALAWGRGERLLTLPALPGRMCLLLLSRFGVSTKDAYGWLADGAPPSPEPQVYDAGSLSTWAAVEQLAFNSFELVVPPRFPSLDAMLKAFRSGLDPALEGAVVLLSGSGATIFVLPSMSKSEHWAWQFGLDAPNQLLRIITTTTSSHVEPVVVAD